MTTMFGGPAEKQSIEKSKGPIRRTVRTPPMQLWGAQVPLWARRKRKSSLAFSSEVAKATGLTPRTIQIDITAGRTLTDGAGSFLPGVPLGCFHIGMRIKSRPRPFGLIAEQEPELRGARQPSNPTQESNAGHIDSFLGRTVRSSGLRRACG